MDSVKRNLNLLDAEPCKICGTLTLKRLPYQDNLRQYYEILDLQDNMTHKEKRFRLYYRHRTIFFHGVLGIGLREQLLACPKDEIERRFPYKVRAIQVGFLLAD